MRYPYEPTWYLDIAHYLGLQWHRWYEAERNLRQTPAPSHRVRMVINRIKPAIKTLLGKMLRGVPRWLCSPTDTTDEARSKARVSEKLLGALYDHCGMYNVQQDVLLWALICGTGYFKVGWDASLGDPIDDGTGGTMYTGDILIEAVTPFELFVPGWVKDLDKPAKVLHVAVYPLEQIKMQFPESAVDLQPDGGLTQQSLFQERLASLTTPLGVVQSSRPVVGERSVYKMELWEDPQTLTDEERREFPKGRLTIIANKTLLYAGPNPFEDGRHPFVRVRGGVFPGRFLGMSVVDDLIPIQRGYNKARSQQFEASNLTTSPQIVAPKNHGVAKQTNEPGSWLEYNQAAGGKPEYMTPPPMNQWNEKHTERLEKEFRDVSQVKEVSEGGLPAANLTGVAINLLQESDNTPWGPVAAEFALGLGHVGQKVLSRAAQGYIEPRIFSTLDDVDGEDVMEFMSDGNQLPVKVKCDATSVMPESKAARMARVEQLIKDTVLNPQTDRSSILKMMEFGQVDSLWMEQDIDERRARRENKRLLRGIPQQIATFDNHEVHITILDQLRKGTEYENLPPDGKAIIDAHANQHLMALAQLKAAMQPMPAPGGGAPSGASGPPPGAAGPNGSPSSGSKPMI